MRKKKILITGASGFIGANLVRRLLKLGHDVHICTRIQSNKWRIKEIIHLVHEHETDFLDKLQLEKLMRRISPNTIYHLAGFGGYPFQKDLDTMISGNIASTSNLLSSLQKVDYDLFVYLGSSSEYGFKKKPMKETDRLDPASFYAATKAGADYICQTFAKTYQKPIVVVRPFTVYGPYEEPTRLIPTAIVNLLKEYDLCLTEGHERRDYIYIDDFIDGLVLLLKNNKQLIGKVVNFGYGTQYTTREVIRIIYDITKSHSRLLWGKYPKRIWDTNYWLADISLAKKKLHFKPEYDLEKGLITTVDWFRKNISTYKFYDNSISNG